MIMKPLQTFLAALLLASVTAQATIYTRYSGTDPLVGNNVNLGILDANPTGIQDTIHVSGIVEPVLSHVSVLINVAGGVNGDLRAYLNFNGILVPLLTRVGTGVGDTGSAQYFFGYSTAGYTNLRLDDNGSSNIHSEPTPSESPVLYHPDGGNLSAFNGGNPNQDWTIFFADLSSNGGSSPSTLVNWSLEITAVPEPVNVALGIFGGIFLLVIVIRNPRLRERIHHCRVAVVHWVDAV